MDHFSLIITDGFRDPSIKFIDNHYTDEFLVVVKLELPIRQNKAKKSIVEKDNENHVKERELRFRRGGRSKITNNQLKDHH